MKTFKLIASFCVFLLGNAVYSQVSQDSSLEISKNSIELPINPKTNNPYRYYYYPNLQAYFDTVTHVYHYRWNGQWTTGETLPPNYGGYSIYNNRKVIIEGFFDDNPYELIQIHKTKYPYNSKGKFNYDS